MTSGSRGKADSKGTDPTEPWMATYAYCPRTGLWALLCFCSIVAPGVADSGPDLKIDRAQDVAAKAWHDPCPGRVRIPRAPPQDPTWLASTITALCQITLSDREAWPWK